MRAAQNGSSDSKSCFCCPRPADRGAGGAVVWRDWESQDHRPPLPHARQGSKPTWNTAAVLSGNAPEQTQNFTVERGAWRLQWKADEPPSSAGLSFTVFSTDASLPPLAEKNGLRPPDKGVLEFSRGRTFYILVSSFDADWEFTVERER